MPTVNEILNIIDAPKMQSEIIVRYHQIPDIVDGTLSMHKKSGTEYDKFSHLFWAGNDVDTARNIFNFVKQYIPYRVEKESDQTGKHPARILVDGISGKNNDCKHYALFICGIMHSLQRMGCDIHPVYIFATDIKGQKEPSHVFAAIKTPGGLVWVDPVLNTFNQFHKYYLFNEYTPPAIMYSHLSGIDTIEGPREPENYAWLQHGHHHYHHHQHNMENQRWPETIGKHGHGKEKLKKALKKIAPGQFLLKVGLATSRNAFLALLKVNAFQMAARMFEHGQTPAGKAKLQNLWRKVGGKWSALAHNINVGYKHYLFHHKRKISPSVHMLSGSQISGPEIPAWVAAAAPILQAFADLLKTIGAGPSAQHLEEAHKKLAHSHNQGETDDTEVTTDDKGNQVLHMKTLPGNNNNLDQGPGPEASPDLMTANQVQNMNPDSNQGPAATDQAPEISNEEADNHPIVTTVNTVADFTKGIKDFISKNATWLVPTGLAVGFFIITDRANNPRKR